MDKQLKVAKLAQRLVKEAKVLYTYSGYSFNKDTNKVYEDKQKDKYQKYKYYTYN